MDKALKQSFELKSFKMFPPESLLESRTKISSTRSRTQKLKPST